MNRARSKKKIQVEHFDLLVIGGGVTGAGIALDAATRGIKTALIEMRDFASGTSSKSTKLIHGGLRYLKQLDFLLVSESGRERAVLHDLVPHLCVPDRMILPIVKGGSLNRVSTLAALTTYDLLAGVRPKDRKRMLSKKQVLELEPLLDSSVIKGAGYYTEYRTDDARLTIELLKTASLNGARIINYTKAIDLKINNGKVCGVIAEDTIAGGVFEVSAKNVISAAGPWVDDIRKIKDSITGKQLHLTKGIHLVFPRDRFPINNPVYFDAIDGRMVFAIPRGQITYAGTTDTDYHASKLRIRVTREDRDYILACMNKMFPELALKPDDVISNWAGLRPLIHEEGKSPSELSRRDEIFESNNGLLSIAGGKLTGYRLMADRIVDLVEDRLESEHMELSKSITMKLPLVEPPFNNYNEVISEKEKLIKDYGLTKEAADYLLFNYGLQCHDIIQLISESKSSSKEEALILAELNFCLKNEMVIKASDFLVRRTGRLYFNIESVLHYRDKVIKMMSQYYNWDDQRIEDEKAEMVSLINDCTSYPEEN